MNKRVSPDELKKLTVSQRLRLMEDIWESLREVPEGIQVPEWHKDELDRRLAERASGTDDARPWSEVRDEIFATIRYR